MIVRYKWLVWLVLGVLGLWFMFAGYGYSDLPVRSEPNGDGPEDLSALGVGRNDDSYQTSVLKVIDGDTIIIADRERVRLLGIDAPERSACYFEEATRALEDLIATATVRLAADVTDRDRYGRLLRHVFAVDETGQEHHLNWELVAGGYARVLYILPDKAHQEPLREAEAKAREAGLGLWGTCN